MHLVKITLAAIAVIVFPASVRAQFTPVSARIKLTVETSEGGKITKIERKEGYFYRTSDGSTLTRWIRVNGDESLGGSGELRDNKNHADYNINFNSKQAFQLNDEPLQPDTPDDFKNLAASTLGDDFVEGIKCRRTAVFMQWPDGRRERTGEDCVSIEYALRLREDRKLTQRGITRHATTEMYEIRLGVEPDPKLFDVSSQFQVYRPEPAKNTKPE